MRRRITIASCLAVLCIVALAIWIIYLNGSGPGDGPGPEPPRQTNATPAHVFELPVRSVFLGDDQFSPCYYDLGKSIVYSWKGVVLRREQVPNAGPQHRIPVLHGNDFTIIPVEAPVKYREVDGKYRPGYLDTSSWVFYAWKGIRLTKDQVPEKGQDAIVKKAFASEVIEVIEIDMPEYLKKQPRLWKKT